MAVDTDLSSIPFTQQQRLRFIESTLLWEGSIQRKRVCDVFHVNANHVTKDFQLYRARFSKSLEYNPASRAYEPGAKFNPVLANGDPAEYLSFLLAYAQSRSAAMLPVLGATILSAEVMPAPRLSIDREVLQRVIHATKRQSGLRALYYSMSSGEDTTRTIWPHALIYTGTQWHLRAFDDRRNEFRNFAIQRIGRIEAVDSASPMSPAKDKDWHEYETVEVVPNPTLNEHQRGVVGREYGMRRQGTGWIWSEKIRRCLVGYFATTFRLDLDGLNHARSYIVLRNKKDLRKFFFSSAL